MSLRLTNSETRDWRRCKRRWWLGQYRGLSSREIEFNNPLSIGTRVHDGLQMLYVPGKKQPAAKTVLKKVRAGIEDDVKEHPAREADIRKEADLVVTMLEGYFEWLEETGADSDLVVSEPEAEVEVPLIEGATLLSKIDARVSRESDGRLLSLEHKTVGSVTDPKVLRKLQVDTQLLTEHLVEFLDVLNSGDTAEVAKDRAEGTLYNMLKKVKRSTRAKPPFFDRKEIHHNLAELRNHWRHVARIAREILATRAELDSGADHHDVCPPNPTADCSWDCDFAGPCLSGLFDDDSGVEQLLADNYVTVDPLERYRKSVGLPLQSATVNGVSEEGKGE